MLNEQILFDTTDYDNYYETMKDEYASDEDVYLGFQEDLENEHTYAVECLDSFIKRYEKRYQTEVYGILMIVKRSQPVYGNWNGLDGRTGYRLIENPDELFETNSDDIRIYIDEDGYINADYFDHDGSDYSKLKLITQSAKDAVEAHVEYSDPDARDYAEYFSKKNQLKPTKFWQEKQVEVHQVLAR